jgi:hypothetical protein
VAVGYFPPAALGFDAREFTQQAVLRDAVNMTMSDNTILHNQKPVFWRVWYAALRLPSILGSSRTPGPILQGEFS